MDSNELETPQAVEDSAHDPAAHLDEIRAPDLDANTGPAADDWRSVHDEITADDVSEVIDLIGKDAFFRVFQTAFAVPAMIQPRWQPVAVQSHEIGAARDASDALYDLLEIYYPAALKPQSVTLDCLVRAGPFIAAKVMVVRSILAARIEPDRGATGAEFKSRRAPEQPARQPAPDRGAGGADWQPDPRGYQSPVAWMDDAA